jgi:hypothetical protein
MLRNVARTYIQTPHVLSLDGDLVTSEGLAQQYEEAIKELVFDQKIDMIRIAVVIPGHSFVLILILLWVIFSLILIL